MLHGTSLGERGFPVGRVTQGGGVEPGAHLGTLERLGHEGGRGDEHGGAGVGTGGAETKVSAARIAAEAGAAVLITATPLVSAALAGSEIGTWFEPAPARHTAPGRHTAGEESALA